MAFRMSRTAYAHMFGPTVGDKVRLADTDLVIEVEEDRTVYGEEVKFGGGKVIRDGMGQGQEARAAGAVDTVITNALILDHWGIVKADIGIKDGRIAAIGKAGNPETQPGVDIVIGPGTEAIAGEGRIVTAGGIDAHVHFICPQILDEALTSGLTTLFGGGTGPAAGTTATTCTPGPWHIGRMLQAMEAWPINVGLLGKGNASLPEALREQVMAGACGLKLHEDWGTTPGRDRLLPRRRRRDGRAGGDPHRHAQRIRASSRPPSPPSRAAPSTPSTPRAPAAAMRPTSSRWWACANVLPSSTNPTRPYTVNTVDEHLDMLMVCHHLDPEIPEDVAFAESRIRKETIAAEDILHDLGAISMMSSDSQAMGRVGEVIIRTWQTAHKMRQQRGRLPEETGDNDNFRGQALRRQIHDQPRHRAGCRPHRGLGRGRQARRSGRLVARLLRRQARHGDQGRHHRRSPHGRPQRLDPDPAAGPLPPDVRQLRPLGRGRAPSTSSRLPRSTTPSTTAAACSASSARCSNTRGGIGKAAMIHNARHARDRGRPRDLRGPRRRRAAHLRARHRAADGAALLPVLDLLPLPRSGGGPGGGSSCRASTTVYATRRASSAASRPRPKSASGRSCATASWRAPTSAASTRSRPTSPTSPASRRG